MKKMQVALFGFCLVVVALAIGCGDDDCPSCPGLVTPLGHTRCALRLQPDNRTIIIPSLEIFSHGAVAPNLDSVKVGDSLVNKQTWQLGAGPAPYADAHWLIPFDEDGDTATLMYRHGDVATVGVWGEGRSSSCQLKILKPEQAAANITEPAYYADTIAPGGSDTVYWNTVEHVDYYAVMIAWLVVSEGFTGYTFEYHYAVDTSFIITGDMQPPDSILHFNVHITPFTGPDPRTGGTNWDGTLLDGIVFSYGYQNSTTIVVRSPIATSMKALPEQIVEQPELSHWDIVANVYKKYGN